MLVLAFFLGSFLVAYSRLIWDHGLFFFPFAYFLFSFLDIGFTPRYSLAFAMEDLGLVDPRLMATIEHGRRREI